MNSVAKRMMATKTAKTTITRRRNDSRHASPASAKTRRGEMRAMSVAISSTALPHRRVPFAGPLIKIEISHERK